MPLVEVSLVEGALTRDQKVRIANEICDLLMREILNLPKEAISVIFYDKPAEDWIVGGVTVKELMEKAKKVRILSQHSESQKVPLFLLVLALKQSGNYSILYTFSAHLYKSS